MCDDADEDYYDWRSVKRRQYQSALRRHPDCRDPDHPGCDNCNPKDNEEERDAQ